MDSRVKAVVAYFEAVIPAKLGNAVATDKKSDVISEGTGQWSNVGPVEGVGGIKGFRPLNNTWGTSSKQFSDPKWKAPHGAALSFQFYCTQPQNLILEVNGEFVADLDIPVDVGRTCTHTTVPAFTVTE